MRRPTIFSCLLLGLLLLVFLSGCTGTRMLVDPDPSSLQVAITKKCGNVAVKEIPPDRTYPPAGNLVPAFARELERSGLFEAVYYPSRPDDKVDLTIDSKFNVKFHPSGGNMPKAFFTGLTLFLLEPAFWFDFYYAWDGHVDVYTGKTISKTIEAKTTANIGMKFLSMGQAQVLEGDVLKNGSTSLYRQLIIQLQDYCTDKK
jgi:hypothetical protein